MAISDFLTNGVPPKDSTFTSTTTQTVLPDWYTNYAMQVLANQQAASTTPYTTFQGPRIADFTPQQQQGFGMTGQAATAYQPGLNQATQTTNAAASAPSGLAVAQPYLEQAGQTATQNIDAYMNPYTEQVVNRIGELGARNLSENLLPQVEGRYIAAGQLGFGGRQPGTGTPSGMMTDTARALRDTQEATLAQQAQALQQGYGQALGASQTDLARAAGLAGTAGGLASTDIGQKLQTGSQQAQLGALSQQLGLAGAEAVTGVGAQQQALNQQNLDLAYSDFLRQQGYPQEQIDRMAATLGAVQGAIPQSTTQEGLVPLGYSKPGTSGKIIGGLSAAAGVASALKGLGAF